MGVSVSTDYRANAGSIGRNSEQQIINPPNPYVGTLGVWSDTKIRVSGRPTPNATRFSINLQTGPSLNPRSDIALHLSPCFSSRRIIRNSLKDGQWGKEESWGNGFILTPFQPFEIMILVGWDKFKIAINGVHYCEFKERIMSGRISHLTIDGDVIVDTIGISSARSPTVSISVPNTSYPGACYYPPYSSTCITYPPLSPSAANPIAPYYPPPSYPGRPIGPSPTENVYESGSSAFPHHHHESRHHHRHHRHHHHQHHNDDSDASRRVGPEPTENTSIGNLVDARTRESNSKIHDLLRAPKLSDFI